MAPGRPWAPYAFDGRLLAGIAAYERGRWPEALDILDVSREVPPEPARSLLIGARACTSPRPRATSPRVSGLEVSRPWWEQEGLVPLLAGSAAIDLYGHADDLAAAITVHDEVVEVLTRVWYPLFQGQLRLDALLLGQLGSHIQRVPTPSELRLLARGAELAESAAQVWDRATSRPGNDGPESTAWRARARAEGLRLEWLGGADVDPAQLVAGLAGRRRRVRRLRPPLRDGPFAGPARHRPQVDRRPARLGRAQGRARGGAAARCRAPAGRDPARRGSRAPGPRRPRGTGSR